VSRLTVAEALVRFLGAHEVERDASARSSSSGASASSSTATSPASDRRCSSTTTCSRITWPATSRRWFVEDGQWPEIDQATPQSASVSTLVANVYLCEIHHSLQTLRFDLQHSGSRRRIREH
jgi:hypothetical protein